MQEEEARQKKASLLADAQRGDVNAARQYAAMQGDLLSATFFLQETYVIHKDGSRSESFWTLDLDFFEQGELAQQGWTPEYVNSVFGGSFDRKFGRLTSISFATEKSPDQVVAKLESNLRNAKTHNDFYFLIPDESNPLTALRPVKYNITIGGNTTETFLVDPKTINNSKLWGNPGTIDTSTGAPTPILYKVSDYQNNTVVNIYLTVYFQSPFPGN